MPRRSDTFFILKFRVPPHEPTWTFSGRETPNFHSIFFCSECFSFFRFDEQLSGDGLGLGPAGMESGPLTSHYPSPTTWQTSQVARWGLQQREIACPYSNEKGFVLDLWGVFAFFVLRESFCESLGFFVLVNSIRSRTSHGRFFVLICSWFLLAAAQSGYCLHHVECYLATVSNVIFWI